jgi:hypothetical protein
MRRICKLRKMVEDCREDGWSEVGEVIQNLHEAGAKPGKERSPHTSTP